LQVNVNLEKNNNRIHDWNSFYKLDYNSPSFLIVSWVILIVINKCWVSIFWIINMCCWPFTPLRISWCHLNNCLVLYPEKKRIFFHWSLLCIFQLDHRLEILVRLFFNLLVA
jgi:hypothetical protein